MKNLKVRTKMLTGFVIVTIIGVTLGIVGVASMLKVSSISDEVHALELTGQGVSEVLGAHYTWRHNLTAAVFTGSEFTGSLDSTTCALGKWLNSEQASGIEDSEVLSMIEQVMTPHNYIHSEAGNIIQSLEAGEVEQAQTALVELILPETQKVITLLGEMENRVDAVIDEKIEYRNQVESLLIAIIVTLVVVSVVFSVFLAVYISGMINKPLVSLSHFMKTAGTTGNIAFDKDDLSVMERFSSNRDELGQIIGNFSTFMKHITNIANELKSVADGNFTTEVEVLSGEDVMGVSLHHMVDSLNEAFGDIHSSSERVSTGSRQVSSGAQALAQSSTEQAASIEQLSASVADIVEKAKANAGMAEKAADFANIILGNAEKGADQMLEMKSAVEQIHESGKAMGSIIEIINDIAFQTNILALNASIEAARAGDAGLGFAVVAREVRELAVKSEKSAGDTNKLLADTIKKADLGAHIAGETAVSLKEIVSGISESGEFIKQIARCSEEQFEQISEINIGIDQITAVVQQNSANAEQSASISEDISKQVVALEELLLRFKLDLSKSAPTVKEAETLVSVVEEVAVEPRETVTVVPRLSEGTVGGFGYAKTGSAFA